MRNVAHVFAALFLLVVCTTTSRADLNATLISVGPGSGSSVRQTYQQTPNNPSPSLPLVPWLGTTFNTFCIETSQSVSVGLSLRFGVSTLELAPIPGSGMGSDKANKIRRLWDAYNGDNYIGTASQQNINNAAFQRAIWTILGYDISNLDPNNNASINSLTNTYVTTAQNTYQTGNLANLVALTNPLHQDQIVEVQTVSAVPLPSGIVLMLVGFAPLVVLLRSRLL